MSAPSPHRTKWIIGGGILAALIAIAAVMNAAGLFEDVDPAPAPAATETTEPEPSEDQAAADDSGMSEDEQAFLDALYEDAAAAGSGIHGFGDEDNVELGYAVCSDIEDGMAPTEVVQSLQGVDGPIADVASELVGHAQAHLCD
ncbi:DUF732 domain-containing protein [Nocardiopsis sp. YSL2]|uniref:DUF732 domain-containing protein n=1 Tax=Nocardiopsis sp. YSL2 TaxID=2939492 RepID=UPI0026F41448|nr:DUF732 domain-containing protein [Nocardiopsis sp. YSL2]